MEEHWVRRSKHLEPVVSERIVKARQDERHDAGELAFEYAARQNSHWKRLMRLVRDPSRVKDVQVEKPAAASNAADRSCNAPTNPGDDDNCSGAGPSSAQNWYVVCTVATLIF